MDFNGDFQEQDIWSHHIVKRKLSTRTPMVIPPTLPRVKSTTISKNESTNMPKQLSAPINIPDWSKIYNKKSSSRSMGNGGYSGGVVEEDEYCDEAMLPPHEYLAKKFARNHIAPPSVCEGVGRTLKGRDLSKVRNDVFIKTDFLE